jgi:hypothetical protein
MKSAATPQELLYSTLQLIVNPDIRRFTSEVLDRADASFWIVPASSTGRYHPPENNNVVLNEQGELVADYGHGWLARHSTKVALLGYTIGYHFISEQDKLDTLVASCILHDLKKHGTDGTKNYEPLHPLIGADFIEQFDLKEAYKQQIQEGIRYHMNILTEPADERKKALAPDLPLPYRIIQIADITASRKSVSFFPGITINPTEIHELRLEKLMHIINKEQVAAQQHHSLYHS